MPNDAEARYNHQRPSQTGMSLMHAHEEGAARDEAIIHSALDTLGKHALGLRYPVHLSRASRRLAGVRFRPVIPVHTLRGVAALHPLSPGMATKRIAAVA